MEKPLNIWLIAAGYSICQHNVRVTSNRVYVLKSGAVAFDNNVSQSYIGIGAITWDDANIQDTRAALVMAPK